MPCLRFRTTIPSVLLKRTDSLLGQIASQEVVSSAVALSLDSGLPHAYDEAFEIVLAPNTRTR